MSNKLEQVHKILSSIENGQPLTYVLEQFMIVTSLLLQHTADLEVEKLELILRKDRKKLDE